MIIDIECTSAAGEAIREAVERFAHQADVVAT